jgi:hypothetical protein
VSADERGVDPTLVAAVKAVFVTAVAFSVIALLGFDARTAVGVALGGGLATLNLVAFILIGKAFLDRRGSSAPWAIVGGMKLLALIAAAWLIIRSELASGLALAAGYGALPVGITLGSLFGKKPNDVDDLGDE